MEKTKSKIKKPRPAKAPGLPAQLEPYVSKHPAELILEHYETQARKLLKAEGLPADLRELMGWHELPRDRKERGQWLRNFEEHHLKLFPEDRGKVLKPRQAALRGVLFQAERTREAIAAGDPQAAAAHSHRLAVAAVKGDLALYGEAQAERGRRPKRLRGILYAIEEELSGPGWKSKSAAELWRHFEAAHRDLENTKYRETRYPHGAEHGNGRISIERSDFVGYIFFDPEDGRLYQETDPKRKSKRQSVSNSKNTGIRFKTFENYFSEVKKALI
jgi:hypothetical protein